MSLFVVATPIGNPKDITLRAIEILKDADIVIGEERSEVSKLLKSLQITGKQLELLNEHSRPDDLKELLQFCREKRVALVSDCGTPGFCDPGADLVAACRAEGIDVSSAPGPSSLMVLLSLAGEQLRRFYFAGFLPAESGERAQAVEQIKRDSRAVIVMDTPYRMVKTLSELAQAMPERKAVLGTNLTQAEEKIYEGRLSQIAKQIEGKKAEFVLLLKSNLAVSPKAIGARQNRHQRGSRNRQN